MVAVVLLALVSAAPGLRVVLDCRWNDEKTCGMARRALDGALKKDRLAVYERLEHTTPVTDRFCIANGHAEPVPTGDGTAQETLWVAPAYYGVELDLAFAAADGTIRGVVVIDDEAFDRFRRAAPSRDGAAVSLIKVTTGLWAFDLLRNDSVSGDNITPELMERVWRDAIRSLVKHGHSRGPPLLGRSKARRSGWQATLLSVTTEPATPLVDALVRESLGRRLPYLLDEYEEIPARKTGAHELAFEGGRACNGFTSENPESVSGLPPALASHEFFLRSTLNRGAWMPTGGVVHWKASVRMEPARR